MKILKTGHRFTTLIMETNKQKRLILSLLFSALEALKLDYLNKGSEVSLSALSFAEAEIGQARTDRTKCGEDYKKEKHFRFTTVTLQPLTATTV